MATSEISPMAYQPGLLPEASLASLSVSPGSAEARAMTVGSGQRWLKLLSVSDPLGCWLKMCLESSRWNSTQCYLTWNASSTPHGRLLFRLVPSTPNTDVSEFGLWPTPTAPGSHQVGKITEWGGSGNPLRKMWPTLTVDDSNTVMLPTPTARDWRSGKASQATMDKNNRPLSEHVGGSLNPEWVEWLMGYPEGWTDLED